MQELLLIGNPARRKHRTAKRKNTAKRRPSAAQLRARAKFAAMSRARAKSRRASSALTTIRSNPMKRRHHRTRRHVAVHRTRHVRRNPARRSLGGLSSSSITADLKMAGMGAIGAIGVDAVFGFAQSYLPASLSTPTDTTGATQYGYYVAKGAAAFGIGMLLKKAIGAAKAAHVVNGSLTVTLHDLLKTFMTANVPSVTLGKYTGVPAPMSQGLRGITGGRALPPLPASQTLRAYIGGGAATRESMIR